MEKKKVAVIFGGCSSEHEVSCVSAYSVLQNLSKDKYDVLPLGITKKGQWYLYSGDYGEIPNGKWESSPNKRAAFISPDREIGGIVVLEGNSAEIIKIDCAFPVLHGKNGEDGTIQGLFQLAGIPFVGCGTLSSAICMDKAVSNSLLIDAGIKKAHYLWFYSYNYKKGSDKIKAKITARLGYPVFVKPANAGSSVGISKVESEEQLDEAIAKAAHEDGKVVVEEAVSGQEVECAVFGGDKPKASAAVGEIAASAEFYDYDDKYKSGKSQLYIPAHLDESVSEEVRKTAVHAYAILGCRGMSRVDFFVRNGNEVLLNELNTIPGFTPISMYPKLWEASGVSYSELLDKLVSSAFE